MTAGLPGVGLGGFFFVLVALAMPLVELVRIARGRSDGDRWPWILGRFLVAMTIVIAAVGSFYVLSRAVGAPEVAVDAKAYAMDAASAPRRPLFSGVALPVLIGWFAAVLGLPMVHRFVIPRRKQRTAGVVQRRDG